MNESFSNSENEALTCQAAVTWIQEALDQHLTLTRSLALASERPWGGQYYSAGTLERWFYLFGHAGFAGSNARLARTKAPTKP